MIEAHQTPSTMAEIMAKANPTVDFPCVMRLHREDPCKGWLLEIHAVYSLVDGHELEDDDLALANGAECVRRFVDVGRVHLGNPATAGADLRVRLMGDSGEWAMYEFSRMPQEDLDAAIERFTVAYGHAPTR